MTTKARIYPGDGDPRHGTLTGYYHHDCHCEACRSASSEYQRQRRAYWIDQRKRAADAGTRFVVSGISHGTSGYNNYSCRCLTCRAAHADYQARRRARAS